MDEYHRRSWPVLLLFLCSCLTLARSGWVWDHVKIGGGGYTTGLLYDPKVPNVLYVRSDVGGLFKLIDSPTLHWKQLLDSTISVENKNLFGIESIALDPTNSSVLYAATGMYLDSGPSDIMRSEDGGVTWKGTGLRNVPMGGNEYFRWAGERLAIDSLNPNIIYFGSRLTGLWRSVDRAATWHRVDSFPVNGTSPYGINFVQIWPTPGFRQSNRIYVGVHGVGVYLSTDAGSTWSFVGGGATMPIRSAFDSEGTLYVSFHDQAVMKLQKTKWQDITPMRGISYSGIAVNPHNFREILCAEYREAFWGNLFHSLDAGATWRQINESNIQKFPDVPWWPYGFFTSATSTISFDPHFPGKVYYTDWFGIWSTPNISEPITKWYTHETGHEETFAITLHTSSNGKLMSGLADVDGFVHEDLQQFPLTSFQGAHFQDTVSIDSSELDPEFVVRAGTYDGGSPTGGAAFSLDGGGNWTLFSTYPVKNNYPIGGTVAVSATSHLVVWRPFLDTAYVSKDVGSTWTKSIGAPIDNSSCCHRIGIDKAYPLLLAADRVVGNVFYILDWNGDFFRSEDGGYNWRKVSVIPGLRGGYKYYIKACRHLQGEIWVSADWGGLWRSSNGGNSWQQIGQFERSWLVAFGQGRKNNSSIPAVYAFARQRIGHRDGIFISEDMGVTWTPIVDPQRPYLPGTDDPWSMAADPIKFGRLYLGTLGRGIYLATFN